MATPYQKVYDSFLSKIKDYNLGELSDVVMEYDMHSLLESAIPYFLCPKVDIFDRERFRSRGSQHFRRSNEKRMV